MIRKLSVKGFKSLHQAEVELGAINVFIGANGVGKSNLLEALGVLGAAAARSVEPEALRYRGVRPGLPTLYKSAFSKRRGANRGVARLIRLDAASEDADYRVSLDNPIGETQRPWGIHSETLVGSDGTILTRSPRGFNVPDFVDRPAEALRREETFARQAVSLRPNAAAEELIERLADYAIYTPATGVLRGIDPDIARPPLGLSGGGLARAVNDLMKSMRSPTFGIYDSEDLWDLIDWANQIAVVPTQATSQSPAVASGSYVVRFRDRYMNEKRNTLSAYDASEGALYVLFLLALSTHPAAPQTFAVDNFDHALHPRLAAALTQLVCGGLLAQGGRQMLLTTHNPLVLDGLDLTDDQIRLFAVERNRAGADANAELPIGATTIRRVKVTRKILEAADAGLSLSRLWVSGRLGAIPRDL